MPQKLWFCRLVLQDIFELIIQCCDFSHQSCTIFQKKKVISDTIFQLRIILGLVLRIYCPYWFLGQHVFLLSMHYIVPFLILILNLHYEVTLSYIISAQSKCGNMNDLYLVSRLSCKILSDNRFIMPIILLYLFILFSISILKSSSFYLMK